MHFWAKTAKEPDGNEVPGVSVHDHCANVGCVAEELLRLLPSHVRELFPSGAATLAALHDIGKITLGFQSKCETWRSALDPDVRTEASYSNADHAEVSQIHLHKLLKPSGAHDWAVAVGAHHGRVKGRLTRLTKREFQEGWANEHRRSCVEDLIGYFGSLPSSPPNPIFAGLHSDLFLLAGLISVADWIGSNELFFSSRQGVPLRQSHQLAKQAIRTIGWPGGRLRPTSFENAFVSGSERFCANAVQLGAAEAAQTRGLILIEAPMGCGKTEAALYAALRLSVSGCNQGLFFALPTQVTSNRIHTRIGRFLENTLADPAHYRLVHGNAWLESDFDVQLRPAAPEGAADNEAEESLREARSWFGSPKHALLAPYGVGTIDQALQAVVAVKHFFVRRFALAGKVVILDEVHSYDVYTGTLIAALIRELLNLGCSVIILSATLTAARRRDLLAAIGSHEEDAPPDYPLITVARLGEPATRVHSRIGTSSVSQHRRTGSHGSRSKVVEVRTGPISESDVLAELIERAQRGQHVLWIRNTVVEAQESFRALREMMKEGVALIGLLHSRFPFARRESIEGHWLERLGKSRPPHGAGSILVATQVVEQSVDIDLDFIVTDLAPTDMLLQRAGRLWRHERANRAAAVPEMWIRIPRISDGSPAELKALLGRSGNVYAPYVLLRTAKVFVGRNRIELPERIRDLLEATYAAPDADEPQPWKTLFDELLAEKGKLAQNAEAATRVLAQPALDDEDNVLTRRKGPPQSALVLLRGVTILTADKTQLTALDGTSIAVFKDSWSIQAARFLHRWVARVPKWFVPPGAPRPHWLTLHVHGDVSYATVRDDGRCDFGGIQTGTTYQEEIGVFSEALRLTEVEPQQWSEHDEFDD